MSKFRGLTLLGLALAAVLTFAACGSDGDEDNGDDAPTAARTTANGGDDDETPAAEPTDGEEDNGGGGGGDTEELQKAAQRFADSTFQVTYAATGAGAPGTQVKMYKDGTDKLRLDFSGGAEGDGSIITNGDKSYLCVTGEAAAQLGVEGDGACIASTAAGTNPFEGLTNEIGDISGLSVQSTTERTIAGRDATCYETLDAETNEVSTVCLDDDGVMLAVLDESADGFSLEATDVSDDVSDSDFEPPYEIAEIPGFGG